MNQLFVTVEDIGVVLAESYTVIRVYTDTAEGGDFTTLDGTITLVAGQESYEYTDLDGTSSTWYKTAYYGAVPGEGDKSTARRGETAAALRKGSTADPTRVTRAGQRAWRHSLPG